MLKSDVAELRKRFTKEGSTFDVLAGCYVNAEKNKVCSFNETFNLLPEDDFFKYLDIAKKSLSGTIGNNIMEYEFPNVEEADGGKQAFLMSVLNDAKNDSLLDNLYDNIIQNYTHDGNYLILVFHDDYDIIAKGSDGKSQDESEEVYSYLIIAICPVDLDKPALKYNGDSQAMESRKRDWIVGMPETSVLFPAFTERSSDIHAAVVYNKKPKESHAELVEALLGCESEKTLDEKREAFYDTIRSNFEDDEQADKAVLAATRDIHDTVFSTLEKSQRDEELSADAIDDMLSDNSRFSDDVRKNIVDAYSQIEGGLTADDLANESLLKKNKDAVHILELEDTVSELSQKLDISEDLNTDTVTITVPRDMGSDVIIRDVDGESMVCIPAEDVEVYVNHTKIQ